MYTRCPECQTTFKLGVADLRRAQGKVRCGDCDHVFNAVEYLEEQAKSKADDGVPVLSSGPTEETAFAAEESLPPESIPEFVTEPVVESISPEPAVEPANNEAPTHAMLEAANDPEISAADNVADVHEESGESWSPLEPSDDWLGNTGVIRDTESPDPAGILFDGDATDVSGEEPTQEHVLPPLDQGSLPTVTMEAIAPKIEGIEDATPPETSPDEGAYGFVEDDEDTNVSVVDPADEPEFQEASFGDQADADDAWSDSVYELREDDPESDPDSAEAAWELTTELATEPATESSPENGEIEGPAPITEAVPDFSDTIWDRIPGVGATDEDWETVRSGQHRSLSEEDQLADGLSYTSTELKMFSDVPEESDAAFEPAPETPESTEPATEQPESLATDVVPDDEAGDAPEDRLDDEPHDDQESPDQMGFSVPADKWESFFGADPQPSQQPSGGESSDDAGQKSATNELDDSDEDPWRNVGEEAGHSLSGIYEQLDTTDFSESEELEEPETAEAAGDHAAEMNEAADHGKDKDGDEDISDLSDTFVSENTETEAAEDTDTEAEANTAATENTDGGDNDDDQISTWSDLEPMEEVVLSTGIFGAAEIASLIKSEGEGEGEGEGEAPERPLGQRTYKGEWQQPEGWADADEAESASKKAERPTWQSDFIDTAKSAGKSSRSWLWLAGIIILVIGFPSQLIHYNRDSLAAHTSYGSFVRSIYAGLGQELYPAWPMDSYEIRGHEAVAGESGQDILDIRTEIAAVGETAVGVPHLRVILRDRWSNPLAARNFTPEEYAGAAELPTEGLMQPNQTIAAQVAIVDPGTGAQGYELELCLPRRNTGLDCTGVPFK